MELIAGLLLALVSLVAYFTWAQQSQAHKSERIPGPIRLPFIGNLLYFAGNRGKTPYDIFHNLRLEYGPIVSIQVGSWKQIIVEDYALIREVLLSDNWLDRFEVEWIKEQRSFGKNLGVLFSNGEVHQKMRRFTLRTLKEFGFGKHSSMEMTVHTQLREVTDSLDKILLNHPEGVPLYVKQMFTIPILNILWTMLAGSPFSKENEELKCVLMQQEQDARGNSFGSIKSPVVRFAAFPFLAKLLPNKGLPSQAAAQKLLMAILIERRERGTYKEDAGDFIDIFLREIDAHKDDPHENNFFTDEQFVVIAMDLFAAGSETTSNTIEFALLYLIKHPDVQTKLQEEIERIIGHDRLPVYTDKQKMPYAEATILEIQRLAVIIPLFARMARTNATIGPYSIPKGTTLICNVVNMHLSKEEWGDPLNFRPERFLDEKMEIINSDKILPFGLGKRICLGESLARVTLFMFITTLFQKYSFGVSPRHGLIAPLLASPGITHAPEPFHALVKPRH